MIYRTVLLVALVALVALALRFVVAWGRSLRRSGDTLWPGGYALAVGFVTNFFDTLGVGSFAPTTVLFRLRGAVADERLPGTLNVGHCLPTIAQALIFIKAVEVEPGTLVGLIVPTVLGGWCGAGLAARLPRPGVQATLGFALLAAAAFMTAGMLRLLPVGGDALGLPPGRLAAGMLAHFVFGTLMSLGVGAYAPMLTTVSLLGMNPRAAFPIMMGACAFTTTVANLRFLRTGCYDSRAALGLALGGIPAVLVAATLVAELPLDALRTLVVVVVLATAIALLNAARQGPGTLRAARPGRVAPSEASPPALP